MNEQMCEQQLSEQESLTLDKLTFALKEIWKIVICCCIGWLMITIGLSITPLLAVVGALVIAIPTVICVRRYGIKSIFNYDYVIVTTYRDGHKTYDHDLGGKLGLLFLQIILTIIIGVFVTPIRYIVYCLKYASGCKQLNFKPEFKLGVLLPTIVGVSVLVIGFILLSVL